jgi:hypothetical protein
VTISTWNELLDEFRALGGIADNVRLGDGIYGRGLFPADPARPVSIHIPESLLIDTADVVFENNVFRVAARARAGAREKAFLENYEKLISWGGGGRAETERIFEQAQALPRELRHELRTEHLCGAWFDDPSERLIQEKFISSRCIGYKGRTVVMPFIDLANHGDSVDYDCSVGIALRGTFSGEVLVRYSDTDSYGMFLAWGFACEQPLAMSVAASGRFGRTALNIRRDFGDFKSPRGLWVPEVAAQGDALRLNYLMLGSRQYPRLCKTIFYRMMHERGLTGYEETFDIVQHFNRMHFLKLLAALEDVEGAMAQTLCLMARMQLQALSYSIGVRAA